MKIGVARKPWKRVSDLQTGHPEKLSVYWMEANVWGEIIERIAHQILAPRRMEGEWFDVPLEVAIAAVVLAASVFEETGVTNPDDERAKGWRLDIGFLCSYVPLLAA